MPIQLPDPSQVGGAWGAGVFPGWFSEMANTNGWDYHRAMSEFRDYVATGPQGPDNQPIDFGWYWNTFRPGGQYNQQVFDQNAGNYVFPGQVAQNQQPPPGGNQPPPGGQQPPPGNQPPPGGQQPPPGNGFGDPRPSQPPAGQTWQTGRYVRVRGADGQYRWEWRHGAHPGQAPPTPPTPAPAPEPAPTQTPPPPAPEEPAVSGPPVVTYPSQTPPAPAPAQAPPAPPPAQAPPPQNQQAAAQGAQNQNYPLGGGNQSIGLGGPPPQAPRPQLTTQNPNSTPGGGGGVNTNRNPPSNPPTSSAMNAQRWRKPGGLLG